VSFAAHKYSYAARSIAARITAPLAPTKLVAFADAGVCR